MLSSHINNGLFLISTDKGLVLSNGSYFRKKNIFGGKILGKISFF